MSISYIVRPARSDDAAAISAMMHASYGQLLRPDYHRRILEKALPRISTARPELLSSGTYFVAECDNSGEIFGAGGWTDISPTRGLGAAGEGHMRHVAVHPAHLRRGIGRAIAAAAIRSAEAVGVQRLRCMSTLTAKRFYESLGFTAVQDIELTLEPGLYFPAIDMRRELAA